jgi:hypothetical protein
MYTGSMRGKGALMFAVMGYVIANQVPEGGESDRMVVELNMEVVSFLLGEELGEVERTVEALCAEDAKSRSKAAGGRRLVKLGEFLYWVVNGRKYREWNREERRREQNREAKRRERAGKKGVVGPTDRERRFEKAVREGDEGAADAIAAEGLPGGKKVFRPVALPGNGDEAF